ncbi:MAG: ATP-binding protein [Candidatus Omnitrophica bacterium]|nr:ATP-binding protein [Candidatus Omnitrophota bacterium]
MIPTEKITKKLDIPSDIGYIKKVSREILAHLQRLKVDKSIQFDIRLSFEEALRNAIEHGNDYKKDLSVAVAYEVDAESIEIEIEDQGRGFDVKKVADPRDEENIMKESGRGVFLIYKLMDKVRYNKKGNKIIMSKSLKNVSGGQDAD